MKKDILNSEELKEFYKRFGYTAPLSYYSADATATTYIPYGINDTNTHTNKNNNRRYMLTA